ncbi:MAG: hypothetical protein ABIZ57_04290 [Candidatus Limnocylindria bacterium]
MELACGPGVAIVSRHPVALELDLGRGLDLPVTDSRCPDSHWGRQRHLVYPHGRRVGPVGTAFLAFVADGRWRAAVGPTLTID